MKSHHSPFPVSTSVRMPWSLSLKLLFASIGVSLLYICISYSPHSHCPDNYVFNPMEINQLQIGFTKLDDPCLISYIRQSWLKSPSKEAYYPADLGLNDTSQYGQTEAVQSLLERHRWGFFIECGAADGMTLSNTLLLERTAAWTGLLIEPNPLYFNEILQHHRKAYAINACLSASNKTERLEFKTAGLLGGLVSNMDEGHKKVIQPFKSEKITAQCFPLYSILLALGNPHIDYFSLDVEGPELDIIKTLPLHQVIIDLFSIEYRCLHSNMSINEEASLAKLSRIREYFESTMLYEEVAIVPWGTHENKEKKASRGIDVFFRRISV